MPRMAPAPTMWPSEVPASSLSGGRQASRACMGALRRAGRRGRRAHQVMPKDSTISSCGVPLTSDLPWMLLQRRRQAGSATIGRAGACGSTRGTAHCALQLRGTASTRMRAGAGRGARRHSHGADDSNVGGHHDESLRRGAGGGRLQHQEAGGARLACKEAPWQASTQGWGC